MRKKNTDRTALAFIIAGDVLKDVIAAAEDDDRSQTLKAKTNMAARKVPRADFLALAEAITHTKRNARSLVAEAIAAGDEKRNKENFLD